MHVNISPSAPIDATYITQTANGTLTAEQNLAALATGLLKSTTASGVLSIAVAGTDYQAPGLTVLKAGDVMTGALLLEGGDQLNGGMIAVKQKNSGGAVVTEFNEFGTIQAFAPNITENDWDVFGGGVVGDAWTRIGFQIDQGVPRLGLGPGNATDRLDTTMERNTGGGFIFLAPAAATVATIQANDAATNTINNVLIVDHGSSGTPAANYGTGLVLKGKSSTTASREMARLAAIWDTATDASRSAALKVLISGTSEVDAAKFDDDATAGNTRLFVYDVDNGQLERVSVGIADSGGLGFKLLRIAN